MSRVLRTRAAIGVLAALVAASGCGDDGGSPSAMRIVETKGEGPGKPARPAEPPDEGELPDTEAPGTPTADEICTSDLRIPSIAALEAEAILSKLVLDGLGHYRFHRDTAWYEEWSVGVEVGAEGQVSPERVKTLWCEALEHWRRLVPPPADCHRLADAIPNPVRIRGPEETRTFTVDYQRCPARDDAREFSRRLWDGFAQIRPHEIAVRRLVRTIGRRCRVTERKGVVLRIRVNDASAEEVEVSGVNTVEHECIERLIDPRVLWEAIAPTLADTKLTELQVEIELHPRQPDRPRRGPDGFLQRWDLP